VSVYELLAGDKMLYKEYFLDHLETKCHS